MSRPELPPELFAVETSELVVMGPGGRPLDGLTFGVVVGTAAALLGDATSGRSQVLEVLTGSARPHAGRAWVAGQEVGTSGGVPDALGHRVGHLGPAGPRVDTGDTPRERLLRRGAAHGLRGAVLRGRVEDLLAGCGLGAAADRPLVICSRAERRVVDLAVAVLHEPGVVLLEDPTVGLDSQDRERLWALIERSCGDEGRTLLLSTADPQEAERLAGRTVTLDGLGAKRCPVRQREVGPVTGPPDLRRSLGRRPRELAPSQRLP